MKIRKVPLRAALILSSEEHHRVVQVVELLVNIARRVDARCVKVRRISANKRKSSDKRKKPRKKQKKENKVCKFCEPCFFVQTLYSETENLAEIKYFIPRDFNDRHHSFNPRQQHVLHHRT